MNSFRKNKKGGTCWCTHFCGSWLDGNAQSMGFAHLWGNTVTSRWNGIHPALLESCISSSFQSLTGYWWISVDTGNSCWQTHRHCKGEELNSGLSPNRLTRWWPSSCPLPRGLRKSAPIGISTCHNTKQKNLKRRQSFITLYVPWSTL